MRATSVMLGFRSERPTDAPADLLANRLPLALGPLESPGPSVLAWCSTPRRAASSSQGAGGPVRACGDAASIARSRRRRRGPCDGGGTRARRLDTALVNVHDMGTVNVHGRCTTTSAQRGGLLA